MLSLNWVSIGRQERLGEDVLEDIRYLCCAFDVLGVAADERRLLLVVGRHCLFVFFGEVVGLVYIRVILVLLVGSEMEE